MRDIRDPEQLGKAYIALIRAGKDRGEAVNFPANPYRSSRMSSDPSEHHSKTPQDVGDLNDGGGEG